MPFLVKGIGSFATLLFSAFIGLNILYYLLADGRKVGRWVGNHIGLPAEVVVPLVRNAFRSVQMYFIGTSIVAVFNGVVIGLGVLLATTIGGVLGAAIASAMAAPFVAISLDGVRQIRAAGIFADGPQEEDILQTGEAGGPPGPPASP